MGAVVIFLLAVVCAGQAYGHFGFLGHRRFHDTIIKRLNHIQISPEKKWIRQPVDHFNETDTRKWNMQYAEYLNYFQPKGPIMVMIGGEGPLNSGIIKCSNFIELGKSLNGALFATEHRYYGESIPLKELYPPTYLTSRQALADLANLIKYLKGQPKFSGSKVLVVGGSYAGNLAVWFRALYPELADTALAASAPVLAKKDFYEYFQTVMQDIIKYGGQQCRKDIMIVIKIYDNLLKTPDGIKKLKQYTNVCESDDLTIPVNQQLFYQFMTTMFAYEAQYGTPEKIKDMCSKVKEHRHKSKLNLTFPCLEVDINENVQLIKSSTNSSYLDGSLSWTYQVCNEFGYAQTIKDHIYVSLLTAFCKGLFGNEYDEQRMDQGIAGTNKMYGGLTPNVTKVVFFQGGMDPWHTIGINKDLNEEAPVVFVEDASHCANMGHSPADSKELIKARQTINDILTKWLSE